MRDGFTNIERLLILAAPPLAMVTAIYHCLPSPIAKRPACICSVQPRTVATVELHIDTSAQRELPFSYSPVGKRDPFQQVYREMRMGNGPTSWRLIEVIVPAPKAAVYGPGDFPGEFRGPRLRYDLRTTPQ